MKLFLQKNENFRALGAPSPDPRASGDWGLCPQTPRPPLASGGWGIRLQTPQTAPTIANFWLRAWNKIAFFSKNLQKSPSSWGLRPQTPVCGTLEYTSLLTRVS